MSNARDTAKNLKTGLNIAANGSIIDVQKNGTTVGSVGTNSYSQFELSSSAALTLEQNSTTTKNLYFSDTTLSTFDGSQSGTVDLGRNVATWKDLYLGGGVYLGGTGAANHLSDYEEGTWTPTSGVTHSYNHASYTKIGQLVFLNIDVQCGSSSSTSALVFSTPFQANFNYSTGSFNYQTTSLNESTINLGPNGIYFRTGQSGGDMNYNQASNARLIFNAIYHTNA